MTGHLQMRTRHADTPLQLDSRPPQAPSVDAGDDDSDAFAILTAVTGLLALGYLAYALLGPVMG